MAAHQYWRLTGFLTDSNVLELSQAQLYDGTQLIAQEPTFTVPPDTGAFPDVLHWDDYAMPGFALVWNLTTPVASPSLRLGAGSSADTFPKEMYCQWSDDGKFWSTNNSPVNIDFPGAGLLTATPSVGAANPTELPAYRYFQFKVLNGDHPSYLGVFEINAVNDGVAVPVTGKTYSANIGWIGTPAAAFDGSVGGNSYFGVYTTDLPLLLGIDFGVPTNVSSFGVLSPDASFDYKSCAFHDFDILGSNDGAAYDTLLSVRNAPPWAVGSKRDFSLIPPASPVELVFIPLSAAAAPKRWRATAKFPEPIVGEPLPAFAMSECQRGAVFMDAYHGGRGIIRATVKQKNTPVNTPLRRRVDLLDERSRLVIRSTWSDPVTGIYAFAGIREDLVYTVVSYDLLHDKRAVIADNLTLANGGVELMP